MSDNALAPLMQSGNLPAFAQQGDAAKLNKEATEGTGGESVNRISLKQSRFRLIVGGEQVRVLDEPYMDVVVLRTNPHTSRAFYKQKYDPGAEDQAPTCYSDDGIYPNPDAREKQAVSCANCPMNQWGSKISEVSGKKIKACQEVKRMAIVPASNPSAPAFQLNVPAASMNLWGTFVRTLNQASPAVPYNGIVTRMRFDSESDFPRLQFEPVSWLTDEQYAVVRERYESDEVAKTATLVQNPQPDPSDVIATSNQPHNAPAQQPAQQTQPAGQGTDPGFGAGAQTQAQQTQPAQGAADGFGGQPAQAQQPQQEEQTRPLTEEERKQVEQAKAQAEAKAAAGDFGGGAPAENATPDASPQPEAAQQAASGGDVPFNSGDAQVVDNDDPLASVFGQGWDD